jgi:hypothetical protein
MSRVVTPPTSYSTSPTPPSQAKIPHEKVAMRAYEKWCQRGCQHGRDVQDWVEAETELRAEQQRSTSTATRR